MATALPFTVTSFRPSLALQPYVQCFRIIESKEGCVNRILPNLLPVLALRLRGKTVYMEDGISGLMPAAMLSGLRKTPRTICYAEDAANLLIVFREGGMSAFFREPVHELFNQSISLDCFTGMSNAISQLEAALATAGDNATCVNVAETFLLQKLLPYKPDALVATAMQQIQAQAGELNIKALAAALFISQDAFEKRFRKIAGATPKQFASLTRLAGIVSSRKPPEAFTGMALDAGYFDQSHFNKAFKLFTGQTPADFFKSPPLW